MESLIAPDGRRATRTDETTGVREVVEFIGQAPHRVFSGRHLPPGPAEGGVVICPALQSEFLRNYRREVELGRALAARGFVAQRFHYRGTGHSDGDGSEATFNTMVEDTIAAAEEVRGRERVNTLAFFGARWGALVAAAAARHYPGSLLALWEPMTDARSYFRDIFRNGRIHALKKGEVDARSTEGQSDRLRRIGRLDVLGYAIDLPLYESVVGRTLQDELGDDSRPVLVAEISKRSKLRPNHAALVGTLTERGFSVEARIVSAEDELWWFVGGRGHEEERSLTQDLVGITAEWISRVESRQEARP